ncbi:hypothetical protein ANCCAN_17787 [Ancylostoma caninum]|uniref:Uncharacterized protein n=1 Tax=Ancylostoma caninum TaxID=29170 RepID=A0A368G161_ANCCA|nr:hypothetical protein ANCCAN_17787 [Ancylostoma caninum]
MIPFPGPMLCIYLVIFAAVSWSTAPLQMVERPPADCLKPVRFSKERSDEFVNKVNSYRKSMVEGKQRNGQLESFLPVGENVLEMVSCKTFDVIEMLFNYV